MKVGLLLIATNKYDRFIQPLIDSADKYFLNIEPKTDMISRIFGKNIEVTYYIFTDSKLEFKSSRNIQVIQTSHKPWPYSTLYRYDYFHGSRWKLLDENYLYYCDADMLFVDSVGEEILSKRVGTLHPGFNGTVGTPERNPGSTSYIPLDADNKYFAGGFNGGVSDEFLSMCNKLRKNIDTDLSNNIIAIHNDESHLNNYYYSNPPTKILDSGYCYGESMDIPYHKRLLALNKNHREIRGKKCGVILFHKNIKKIYNKRWVDRCIESLINQTHRDFKFYEVNYGDDDYSLLSDYKLDGDFYNKEMSNHAEAMNFIIDKSVEDGCDVIFNVNLDDNYSIFRISKQLDKIEEGFSVVSSDFAYIEDDNGIDKITKFLPMSQMNINDELNRDNNIIGHPVVCFTKEFWSDNRYKPEEIPREDLDLWKRSIDKYKFHIIPDVLLFYRIHDNQVSKPGIIE